MRSGLRRSADEAALGGRVVMEGQLPPSEVVEALRTAAVVVVPSLGVEGGGPTLAVIEAMCSGRPVIVSNRPGVSEGVDDEVGAVVVAGDAAALAGAIDRLLGDRGALRCCGDAARRRAQAMWSPGVAVPRIRAIYRAVIVANG